MLPRTLARFARATSSSHSFIPSVSRHAYHNIPTSISDPPAHRGASSSISLAHPRDPGTSTSSSNSTSSGSSSSTPPQPPQSAAPPPHANSPPPPPSPTSQDFTTVPEVPEDPSVNSIPPVPVVPTAFEHHNDPPEPHTSLPSPHSVPPSMYAHPPFDTHRFFAALERTFATATARNLMRATRALLIDRIGRVRKEALTVKDLESVSHYE